MEKEARKCPILFKKGSCSLLNRRSKEERKKAYGGPTCVMVIMPWNLPLGTLREKRANMNKLL